MDMISLQDLQRDPAGLLARVEAGEHLVVSREGRPIAELRPLNIPARGPRPFGLAAGSFLVPADSLFHNADSDVERGWTTSLTRAT